MNTIFFHNKNIVIWRRFALVFIFSLGIFLSGCGDKSEVAWYGPVADLKNYPQDLEAYIPAGQGHKPLVSKSSRDKAAKRYVKLFYSPWTQKKSTYPRKDATWATKNFAGKSSWKLNGTRLTPDVWDGVIRNANIKKFPSLARKGIMIENAPLRALPTNTPFYKNPQKAGEGYPFDYLQYITLWTGMPVFISHISRDKQWVFCETSLLSGWVPSNSVSPVTDGFIRYWQDQPLGAIVRDKIPLEARRGKAGRANANDLRVGTILPWQEGNLLVPVAQGTTTSSKEVSVPSGAAVKFPMPLTASNVARVGNSMMGEPYGWGGLDYLRDCSSLTRDLFTPFGLWLPRNSFYQAKVGRGRDLSGFSPVYKERAIRDFGKPFVTLVGMPGHIMLYVGQYQGKAVVYHDMWAARTILSNGEQGRLIVGKVLVSSLKPGVEHSEVNKVGTLLDRVKNITIIPGN